MGIWERMPDRFLDALGTEFDFAPPRDHGLDTVGTIRAMRDGQVRVFFAMGGNFVAASPDTEATEAAMRRCRLTVHVSTKLNRSHVVTGARALILPALARTDIDLPSGFEGGPGGQDPTAGTGWTAGRDKLESSAVSSPGTPGGATTDHLDLSGATSDHPQPPGTAAPAAGRNPSGETVPGATGSAGGIAPDGRGTPGGIAPSVPGRSSVGRTGHVGRSHSAHFPRRDAAERAQFVTVEDSMGIVHASRGSVPPLSSHMRSEVAIVTGLARAVFGPDDPVPWEDFAADYDRIRDRIERVVPGFADYNARARLSGGFALPHAPRDERVFPTATGKANFTINPVTSPEAGPGRLLLQTLRSHDQFNTTVYGLDDRYRGIHDGRRVVLVNPEDAAELGLGDGDYCDLVSEWSDGDRRAPHFRIVHYPTARGCAAAYFPETNVLVPLDSVAEFSNTPTSKSIVVRFEPDSGPSASVPA
jgi:anaerobic selenocysteine-containing dehydrogenase